MTNKAINDLDMSHPKIQGLLSSNARKSIELRIIEQLITNPDYEQSGLTADYWLPIHDKIIDLKEALQELVSIVEIHSKETNNNFAWAELAEAKKVLNND